MQKQYWLVNSGTLFAGLLMLLLLGACAQVTVTCPPAGGIVDGPPGGCNPGVAYSGPADAANNFFDTVTNATPAPGSMCSLPGSKKCPPIPGKCGLNNCKNWFRDYDNKCYCGCP